MDHMRSTTRKICAGVVSVCAATTALAADQLTVIGGASLELHDNAPLTKKKESDLVRVATAQVGYTRPEGTVTGGLDYRAERRDYLHDTQGDQNVIDGNASLLWHIAPQRLDFVASHQIAQEQINRAGPDVTSNQEERSIVTAGVDGYLHFSPVDSVVLRPRFSDISFEESDASNSERSSLVTTWTHRLDSRSALDLTGNYDHVTFDESINDYDGTGLMLAYRAALARLNYSLGFGGDRISRDEGKDFSGTTVRAAADYRGEGGFSFGGSYFSQLTDSAVGLSGLELTRQNFHSNDSNFEQPDVIKKDQFDLYLDQTFGRASVLHLGASYLKEDYKDTLHDDKIYTAQAVYRYTINSFWSVRLEATFEREEFLDDPNDLRYNTVETYATLTYKPLKRLDLNLSVGREKRSASESEASYTDNVATFGVQYQFY